MGKKLILLVDDEDIVRLTTEEILKELGFEVVTASCAAEAIERLKDKAADIDLIILDMTLPDKPGIEICHDLRKIKPGIKILLTSGMSLDDYKTINGCKNGENSISFIKKPYSVSELNTAINVMIGS